jgi:hypothetical protein
MWRLVLAVFVPVLFCVATVAAGGMASAPRLDRAFRRMYNLNFTAAQAEIVAHNYKLLDKYSVLDIYASVLNWLSLLNLKGRPI